MGTQGWKAIGTGAGAIWALFLLAMGARLDLPVFTLVPTIFSAFLAPGVVVALMLGRVRMFASGAVDRLVLRDTLEQVVLALCVWPAAAIVLQGDGPGVIVALGLGFAGTRLVYWAGARWAPPVRAFGLAAGFYPTVAVAGWALWRLIASFSAA